MAGHAYYKKGPCKEIINSPSFRSAWERNVYRVFQFTNHRLQYEIRRYVFDPPYRRTLDYLPDFVLEEGTEKEQIIEVKGWLDGKSKTKLLGFKKHYPDELKKLIVITDGKKNILWCKLKLRCEVWEYSKIKKEFAGLVVWE